MSSSASNSFSFSYDPDGNRKETVLPNGIRYCSKYDEAGRPQYLYSFSTSYTCASPPNPATQLSSYRQKFDLTDTLPSSSTDSALIQSITDAKTSDLTTYTYDVLDRLTDAAITTGSNAADFAYQYDGAGNRTKLTRTIGSSGTPSYRYYAYNAANELCKFSTASGPDVWGEPGGGCAEL